MFEEYLEKAIAKERVVVNRNRDRVPYTTGADGRFDDCSGDKIGWWTNGFWGGILWQMYAATGEEIFREEAIGVENKLDAVLLNADAMDHDSGFRWLPTSHAHFLNDGAKESMNRLRLAADNMMGRFNMAGRFFRAWNEYKGDKHTGWAIIDCMMNLPLLYIVGRELEDPRYRQTATAHADTAMKYFVREDGSVNHIVVFDPESGAFSHTLGGQGYAVGSTWTRGQAWAVYGFTLSFLHTGKPEYLETARKCADYFVSHIPETGVIPVDFAQPAEPAWEDETAAVIAACGLIELSRAEEKNGDAARAEKYMKAAEQLVGAACEKRCDWTENKDNILEKCTAAYHDQKHEFAIIYGDYYLIEALMKLNGKDLKIWL